jgi:hypothetical protein
MINGNLHVRSTLPHLHLLTIHDILQDEFEAIGYRRIHRRRNDLGEELFLRSAPSSAGAEIPSLKHVQMVPRYPSL